MGLATFQSMKTENNEELQGGHQVLAENDVRTDDAVQVSSSLREPVHLKNIG